MLTSKIKQSTTTKNGKKINDEKPATCMCRDENTGSIIIYNMASDYRIISLLQYIFCLKVMQVKVYVMAS
jgi:hypothetical protein